MAPNLVGFTGAGGTGKTTTAEFLVSEYAHFNVPSLVSYVRQQIYGQDSKFNSLNNFDDILSFQYQILSAQIATEEFVRYSNRIENLPSSFYYYVERSVIDYAAYTLNTCEEYIKNSDQKDKVDKYVNFCIDYANKNYKGIVYFPINKFTPSDNDDKLKERDNESRNRTDELIKSLLTKVNIPILKLNSVDLNDRALDILNFI